MKMPLEDGRDQRGPSRVGEDVPHFAEQGVWGKRRDGGELEKMRHEQAGLNGGRART
jgi:hypothetical protein